MTDYAKRLVQCEQWEWRDGMCTIQKPLTKRGLPVSWRVTTCSAIGDYPDLSDDATIGCLLGMLREHKRWGGSYAVAMAEKVREEYGCSFGEAVAIELLEAWEDSK